MMSNNIVKLNVGGVFYDTTQETLYGSKFFMGLLKNNMTGGVDNSNRYFIDRSGIIFEHVLNLLRNPNYLYPEKYLQELDFYLIAAPQTVEFSNNTLMHELSRLKKRFNQLRKCQYKHCKLLPVENFQYCKRHGYFTKNAERGKNIKLGSVVIQDKNHPLVVEKISNNGKRLLVSSLYGDKFEEYNRDLEEVKIKTIKIDTNECFLAHQINIDEA